jgi:hypothetical protein
MVASRALVGLAAGLTLTLIGCQQLISADATPVPGAAATLTRSSRTAIPTPVRTPSPVAAVAMASPSRSPSPSPSSAPVAVNNSAEEARIADVSHQLSAALASQDLPGIEDLLVDRVSLSTSEGGQVFDRAAAASWLRDHAGPGLQVGQVDRSSLSALLEIHTSGWPDSAPIMSGQVTFNLHRYDPNGIQDDDNGDWRIDVIQAD